MPPKKKIGGSIVIFDANSSGGFKLNAIEWYKQVCERKFFSDSPDVTKLYLMNAQGKDSNETTFPITDFVCYNPANRKQLTVATPTPGDWLRGLEIAVNDLYECFEQKSFSKYQIAVLSDLKTPLGIQPEKIKRKIKEITKTLNEYYGYVYFIGINVKPDKLITDKISAYEWMETINVDENYNIAVNVVQESLGIVCDFDIGTDLFISYNESSRGFPFTESLAFGELLRLPTATMKFINKAKYSIPKSSKLRMDTKFVLKEDQETIVPYEDIVRGCVCHEKLVILPTDVTKGIQDYTKCFKLLGFTDAKNIPPHYMLKDATNLIMSYEGDDPEVGYINYIIEAAEKYNKYGLALKVHRKGCAPKLFCLIPKTNPHYFIMVRLPFAEAFRCVYKEYDLTTHKMKGLYLEEDKEDVELQVDVFSYLDSINLDDKIQLHPHRRQSDYHKRTASIFLDKLEGKDIGETTPLNFFGIEFEKDVEIAKKIRDKFECEQEEPEDMW